MTIFEFEDALVKNDHEGASALFEKLQNAVTALANLTRERNQALLQSEEEKKSQERRHVLAVAAARKAAAAYEKANAGYHFLSKGDRRYNLCQNFLRYLSGESKEEEMTPLQLAKTALEEGEALRAQVKAPEEQEDYLKKNRKLHKLMENDWAEDEDFILNYPSLMQVMKNLDEYAKGRDEDLRSNVAVYSRFFEYRARMLANPLHKQLKDAKVGLDKEEARKAFYEQHPELSMDDIKEYELCRSELKLLEKNHNLSLPKTVFAKEKNWKKGSVGSKTASLTSSLLTAKYSAGGGVWSSAAGLKVRTAKIGAKWNYKYFKASVSASAGSARINAGHALDKIVANNATNNREVGVRGMASGYGAKVRGKVRIGGKNNHIMFAPFAEGLSGNALATGQIGRVVVQHKDSDGNVISTDTDLGAAYTLKYGKSLATVGGTAGISILGVKFSATVKGAFGGAGGVLTGALTTGQLSFSLGLTLGAGMEFGLAIDWSQLRDNITKFFRRKSRVNQEKREQKVRESLGGKNITEKQYDEVHTQLEQLVPKGQPESIENAISVLRNQLPTFAKNDGSKENPFFEKLLKTADAQLAKVSTHNMLNKFDENKLKLRGEDPEGKIAEDLKKLETDFDRAMAAVVCANLIQVQRKIGVPEKDRLEKAIHSEKHMNMVMDQIIRLNQSQPEGKRFWSLASEEAGKRSLTQENINHMVKHILKPVVKNMEAGKKASAQASKNAVHKNKIR